MFQVGDLVKFDESKTINDRLFFEDIRDQYNTQIDDVMVVTRVHGKYFEVRGFNDSCMIDDYWLIYIDRFKKCIPDRSVLLLEIYEKQKNKM